MSIIYWEYAGTRYKRKFQAIQAAGRDFHKIKCGIFDDSILSFDFSVEPPQTLSQLIDERCYQLRDKYSYIKLWFSGGTDSTTVLNGFLQNNIYIDEIIVYSQSLTDDFNHIGNYELNEFTLPYLKNLSKHLTKTKFTHYLVGYRDYLKFLDDTWLEKKNDLDIRTMFSPRLRGSNFCNIYADLYPRISNIQNKYYDIQYDTDNVSQYQHKNVELFYTSSDLPSLHAKQCHIVKNYLKTTNQLSSTKQIARELVRDIPVAKEHPSLIKTETDLKDRFFCLKSGAMMKQDPNAKLIDRYKYILNSKINGISVKNLNVGFKLSEIYLGE